MIIDSHTHQLMIKSIDDTRKDYKERGFILTKNNNSQIIVGDCDNITLPLSEDRYASFHTHTIENSALSQDDIDAFKSTNDDFICYAMPMINYDWMIKCYDRDLEKIYEEIVKI